jgi:predicted RNase H-like HicB family nuclease
MFEFEKHYQDGVKKVEEAFEHLKQANEFWINAVLSTAKTFFKTK